MQPRTEQKDDLGMEFLDGIADCLQVLQLAGQLCVPGVFQTKGLRGNSHGALMCSLHWLGFFLVELETETCLVGEALPKVGAPVPSRGSTALYRE